jgi:D-xylonolactonase
MKAEIAVDCGNILGESPVWDPESGMLHWLDLARPGMNSMHVGTGRVFGHAIETRAPLGALVRSTRAGCLLLARRDGIVLVDLESMVERTVAHPLAGRMGLAYNDAGTDNQGRLWVGTAELTETRPDAVLFKLESDGSSTIAESGFTVSNGPAFSADGATMYVSDTLAGRVLTYDVDADGTLRNKRVFVQLDETEGIPDGLAVDVEGGIWIAHWGGSRITRWTPDGTLSETILVPTPNVTSMAFAGEGMATLFITTAAHPDGGRVADAGSGALYIASPGIAGLPDWPCSLGDA